MFRCMSLGALLLAALTASACQFDNDYGIDGCASNIQPLVPNFWAGQQTTDVTFFAFGDPLVEVIAGKPKTLANAHHVAALNAAAHDLQWPTPDRTAVSRIRGVVIAGSLSQSGFDAREPSTDELSAFSYFYGLCGNRSLTLPVYEGYGISDYYRGADLRYRTLQSHPVIEAVSVRTPHRTGVVNQAPGEAGHYSWEWDNVHFVQLNLAPSNIAPAHPIHGLGDPRGALTFLISDLARHVDGTRKSVILIADRPPTSAALTPIELDALTQVLANRPILAYLYAQGEAGSLTRWHNIPLVDIGSPSRQAHDGSFTILRVVQTRDSATLQGARARWTEDDPTHPEFPHGPLWTVNLAL